MPRLEIATNAITPHTQADIRSEPQSPGALTTFSVPFGLMQPWMT